MYRFFIFASLISYTLAGCPNKCSGHGNCGLGDTCSCQPRWLGPDCGSRECPYGVSWVTSGYTDNAPSGSAKVLYEGRLDQATAADALTISYPETNPCGGIVVDCSGVKGKHIQFLSTSLGNAAANPGGIWSQKFTIASLTNVGGDGNPVNYGFTTTTALDMAYKEGTKYRITSPSGGMTGLHEYTECSSKGSCDRSTGQCACFDGYEGRGCRRQACANSCSGHGRCVSNNQVNSLYSPSVNHPNEHESQYWDYQKARQCSCDRGWEGNDCSSRICPKGDDPLTDCNNIADETQVSDVQILNFATHTASGYFTLTFTDMFNGNYTTTPIFLQHAPGAANLLKAAAEIEGALEALPNFAVPNVTVTKGSANDAHQYYVTFVDDGNAGDQHLLKCSKATSPAGNEAFVYNNANMQPRFAELSVATDLDGAACTAAHDDVANFGAGHTRKEHTECSQRGQCDGSTGTCTCYEGFSGEACSTQTVFF